MSSGPEHYKHAEECLELAGHSDTLPGSENEFLLRAQVHATLALAAATALPHLQWRDNAVKDNGLNQSVAWREAIGGEAS